MKCLRKIQQYNLTFCCEKMNSYEFEMNMTGIHDGEVFISLNSYESNAKHLAVVFYMGTITEWDRPLSFSQRENVHNPYKSFRRYTPELGYYAQGAY